MSTENTKNMSGDKGIAQKFDINSFKFDPKGIVKTKESYGLDLSNLDLIKYSYSNIEVEVIGFKLDADLTKLSATFRIKKKRSVSPTEIYRSQLVDLMNPTQVSHLIRKTSETIQVETVKVREALADLTLKLETYKRDLAFNEPETSAPVSSNKALQEVKKVLKKKDLLKALEETLERAGVPDGRIALQLFVIGLTRNTSPLHTIIQGNLLLANEIVKAFAKVLPLEQHKEATSISKQALSYPPSKNYWQNKLLVLHQFDGAVSQKNSAIEEYMKFSCLQKLVTEVDNRSGRYYLGEKYLDDKFSILGYTSKDLHPLFSSQNVILLPICSAKKIRDKIGEKEIRLYGGFEKKQEENEAKQLLINVQRYLKPERMENPYLEEIDLQSLLKNDVKRIKQFLNLSSIIAHLHKEQLHPKKKNGNIYYEIQPKHMLMTLELFKELWVSDYDELYFRISGTFNLIKKTIKKEAPNDFENYLFKEKEMFKKVGASPSTFNKHLKRLCLYNKLERIEGNNRTGFVYKVTSWDEDQSGVEDFQRLKTEIENLIN